MKKSDQELSAADRARIQQSKQKFKVSQSYATRRREELEADDAGMTVEAWRALTENERTRLWEISEDSKFAKNSGLTLAEFRVEKRRRIEAGEIRGEYGGFPQWLRNQYAAEDPRKFANDLAQLVFHGRSARGELLKQTIIAMEARTGLGWPDMGQNFAELCIEIEMEADRLGIRQQFNQALASFERNNI